MVSSPEFMSKLYIKIVNNLKKKKVKQWFTVIHMCTQLW